MRESVLVFAAIVICSSLTFGQWEVVKEGADPGAFTNWDAASFIDENTGWIMQSISGKSGWVIKTTDGGCNWQLIHDDDGSDPYWNDIEFIDANVGYGCGDDGYIYKTTDGGTNWTMIGDTANYTEDLTCIAAITSEHVFFSGDNGTVLSTTNGGDSYIKSDSTFLGEHLDGGIAFLDANVGVVFPDGLGGHTWYTHDGGSSWNYVNVAGLFPTDSRVQRMYDVAVGPDSLVALCGYHYVILLSKNGGKSYELISTEHDFGFVYCTAIELLDENTITAGGSEGFLVKTNNGGTDWTVLDPGFGHVINYVHYFNANTGIALAENNMFVKTTDGGTTWAPMNEWPTISFREIAVPAKNKIVLGSFGGGEITMSNDGGITWLYPTNSNTQLSSNIEACDFIDAENGLIGAGTTLLKTSDGGDTFTAISNPYTTDGKTIYVIKYYDADTVFAGGKSGYLLRSVDGGATWNDTTIVGSEEIFDIWPLSGSKVLAAADAGQFHMGEFASDNSVTGTLLFDAGSMDMLEVEVNGNNVLITATKGHIYHTTTDQLDSYIEVFTDPDGDDINSVEFIDDSTAYAVCENGKIYKSTDAGLNWTAESSPTSHELQKIKSFNKVLWAVGDIGTILKLDLNPPSLTIAEAVVDADGDYVPDCLNEVVTVTGVITTPSFTSGVGQGLQDATGAVYLYTYATSAFDIGDEVTVTGTIDQYKGLTELSVDAAEDITVVSTGNALDTAVVNLMDFGEAIENHLVKVNNVWLVEGQTWPVEGSWANLNITDGIDTLTMRIDDDTDLDGWAEAPTTPFSVVGIASQYTNSSPADDGYQIIPRFQEDVVCVVDVTFEVSMVYYILAGDFTAATDFVDVAGTFNGWDGANHVLDDSDADSIYAITLAGMIPGETIEYKFRINGSWDDATCEFPYGGPNRVLLIPEADTTVFHWYNNITSAVDPEVLPTSFALHQNFPNPFNPITTICFDLPHDADVRLVVFNIIGQQVAELKNESVPAGSYRVQLDGSQLSSGVYFYRIQAGGFTALRKMVLMK